MSAPPRLLLDENVWTGLAAALCERGYDVVHINSTPFRGVNDIDVLELAASESRAVLTFNHRDFVPLARSCFEQGKSHSGIILSIQLSQGPLLRQILSMLTSLTSSDLANSVRWLQEFR